MSTQFLVRAHDPLSSVMAAERAVKFSNGHCAAILADLSERGPATAQELQDHTGLTVVQIARRLPELKRAGKADVVQINGADLIRNGYRVWRAV